MDSQNSRFAGPHDIPATYRLTRTVVRLGVRLFSPGLRLLRQEKLDGTGPAILLIAHPRSLSVALLLVAALDRQVHSLIPTEQIGSAFGKLACWALRIRTFKSLPGEKDSLLDLCLSLMGHHGVIAIFAEPFSQNGGPHSPAADFAARLALETILEGQGHSQPALYAAHWYLSRKRSRGERLAYVEGPIQAHQFLPKVGEDVGEASVQLAEAIQKMMGANIFGLAEPELKHFGHELEDLSREHLQIKWSRQPDWKQRPEQLRLSGVARRWIAEQNRTDPAHLVEVRESLAAYREGRRRFSMGQIVSEIAGPWQSSALRVAAAWSETVLGFPVALYGLVNHLPAGIILSITGFLKSSPKRDPKSLWLARIFAVLSFYTLQVFLVHHWWGRAAAGYYALTLPVSGAYLWRYRWLLQNRAHVLILKALRPSRAARLAKTREEILARFSNELEKDTQPPQMAFEQSAGPAE